jgi:MoxR-like ATPase
MVDSAAGEELKEDVDLIDAPAVWIEKTSQKGREYKQHGELALGKAIISPSRDQGGRKRYETLREAAVGDIVLHLLQEREQIVGVSRISSELQEDFEGPPDGGWSETQVSNGGYKRTLEGYVELEDPVEIFDDVLSNERYSEQLQQIRKEYDGKIIYNKRLALNQGHYFTEVPSDFLGILASESGDLSEKLHSFSLEVPKSPLALPEPAESYETISEAMEDIQDRLNRVSLSNWLADELTATVIEDWSEVLTNFNPSSVISPTEEVRLQQIRQLYSNNESRLRENAEEIGSGSLNRITKPQTLFAVFLRSLQEQTGLATNVNQEKIKIALNEEYEVTEAGKRETENGEKEPISHPLLSHLDNLATNTPVRKFTAPPDYWLTALRYGTVSFGEEHREVWEDVEQGEIAILHSRADPSQDTLSSQPNGIIGAAILGTKATKEELWWRDETEDSPYRHLMSFERLFVTSNVEELDVATPNSEVSQTALEAQLSALTAGILEYERVQEICEETNGTNFPAQGAHAVFRDNVDNPDHNRPRALLEELAGRLQETATVNAHETFTGTLSSDILDGLYFPGDQKEGLIEQIEAALRTGKHIILTGPPGTGKTEIARKVCKNLEANYPYLYTDFQLTTATADWSTFDTVGGYMPEESGEDDEKLTFTPGIVLNRLKERRSNRQVNEPIIIDELNRADIDKAFGQLFTLLSGQSVQLPYTRNEEEIELLDASQINRHPKPHQYVVPESWRIFATMNTYDKTSLYEMSYAFMRRFAFIRVGAPSIPDDDGEMEDLMHEYAAVWDIPVDERDRAELQAIGRVWRAMNTAIEDRAIGPAIVKDIVAYVGESQTVSLEDRLTRAVISYIFPQLEGVPKREQIVREIAAVDAVDNDALSNAAREMLQVTIGDDE